MDPDLWIMGNITRVTLRTSPSRDALLMELNEEQALLYLPVIVYMALLMVVGTTGNLLVCYVFYNKPYRSTSRIFILTLAVLDLTCCVVGMVVEIVDLRFPYTFDDIVACRLLRFTTFATSIASGTVLVCVAFDRFFKVCRPIRRQLSGRVIRRMCIGATCLGAFCSWPAVLLFGIRAVQTKHLDVVGTDCSTSDNVSNTFYPIIYYGFLLSLFVVGLVILIVLYTLIGTRLYHLKKRKPTQGALTPAISSLSVTSGAVTVKTVAVRKPTLTRRFSKALRHTTKTTWMLFVITLVFVLSFLPYLIVMVLRHTIPDFEFTRSPSEQLIVNFCLRSYFINSSVNPIIYALMNRQFRLRSRNVLLSCTLGCNKYR
ncbi:neuromedin-U receptor 2-like [Liolophura sinensis]|uniref:neuromedin-U receptor 2-like n=1 Tax=Liolophura sinensis TaxID=3198878 RepID=UPI00315895FD